MFAITVDTRGLDSRLRRLRQSEIPSAMRHTLNDLAFDTRGRIVQEIQRVFDRPTPVVQKLPQVKKQRSNADRAPELWLTDFFNRSRTGPSFAVEHHIHGRPGTRSRKGLEIRLERMGRIGPDEWMMPSRNLKLNAYGNVAGSVISKMISDVGAYGQYAGDAANTGSGIRTKRAAKQRYFWAEIGGTKGIWTKLWAMPVLQMVAVKRTPRYAPRFKFHAVARSYAAKRIGYHAARAVEQQIARRNR